MASKEISYDHVANIPLHYDRKEPFVYGTKGKLQTFESTKRLKTALEAAFADLFAKWQLGKPDIILTAGTIGDGMNAHGKGLAFDLDGFVFGDRIFLMDSYPRNRLLYIAINAHLFGHFTQVLSYHYPLHRDHFHVDFNFTRRYRPESNAQTFFVQSAIKYVGGADIGKTGPEKDGVDGVYGESTRKGIVATCAKLGLTGTDLKIPANWVAFIDAVAAAGFAAAADFNP